MVEGTGSSDPKGERAFEEGKSGQWGQAVLEKKEQSMIWGFSDKEVFGDLDRRNLCGFVRG